MTSATHDTETYVDLERTENSRKSPLSVRAFGRTHPGRVRKVNEDHFLVAELTRRLAVTATSLDHPPTRAGSCRGHLFLVADGMGGHRAGEMASSLSVWSIESFLLNSLKRFICSECIDEDLMDEFRKALEQADAAIIDEATAHAEMLGMGTTLTLAFAIERTLFVAHVGDSRCYHLSNGELKQITRDHTVAAELVAHGVLTPEQAERSPYRNSLTNALGGRDKGVQTDLHVVGLAPGDTVLVCSDGLHGALGDEEITNVLNRAHDPDKACAALIAEANNHGGKDNITAIVARFEEIR